MDKRKIGSRVNTPYGCGTVVGYDLENSRAWRHQVELDNGKLWGGEHPCFYHSEITDILSDQKPASNKDYVK